MKKKKTLKSLSIFRAVGGQMTPMKQKQDSIKKNSQKVRKSSQKWYILLYICNIHNVLYCFYIDYI